MGSLREDLLLPSAYPAAAAGAVELLETHASWVFLAGSHVFKVKKPVDLGFLDFSTVERRRAACEAELRLNARLAPEVYLDVLPVRRGPDGTHRVGGGVGETVDWAVHMRRLDESRRADHMLERGQLRGPDIDAIASHLARFHATARCDQATGRFGRASAIERNVLENFAQTRQDVDRYVRPAEAHEIEARQTAFLRDQAHRFQARIDAGKVRDGHGDLRLEHVYLTGATPTIIDCIEFNDRFRFADVCADVAFLSMDLAGHARVDLAERLLARYARESNDFDLYGVVDFYESYRAYVRAKVAMILAADPVAADDLRSRASADARRHLLLSLSAGRRALVGPVLVCVGGLIASGKSTIADALGAAMSAPVVEADRTRKHMIGVAPAHHVEAGTWQGAYDPVFTERVYEEILRRAAVVLASGRPAIVDASFRSRRERARARAVAAAQGIPFRFIECRATADVCRDRLVRRESEATVSDARLALFDAFRASYEPVDDLPPDQHVVVDTTRALSESIAQIRTVVQTWPAGLVA